MHPVETSVVDVSPAWAERVLDEQVRLGFTNRRVLPTLVQGYAKQMTNGLWRMNGQPIIFNGVRLLDGQHRLRAVVEAGVTVPMMVVRGVNDDAFATLDTGRKRLVSDVLSINGHTNAVLTAGAANLVMQYVNYEQLFVDSQKRFSTQEIADFADTHRRELADAVALVAPTKPVLGVPSTATALAVLIRSHPRRDPFFISIADGIGLHASDPVHVVRQRFITESANRMTRAKSSVRAAWLVKAWNAYATGRPLGLLRWNPNKEEFPQIVGV